MVGDERVELSSTDYESDAPPDKLIALGTPAQIRTERTSPFERDDFTNLSTGAFLVRIEGLEPPRLSALVSKTSTATNYAISAKLGATRKNRTYFNGSSDHRYDHIS